MFGAKGTARIKTLGQRRLEPEWKESQCGWGPGRGEA